MHPLFFIFKMVKTYFYTCNMMTTSKMNDAESAVDDLNSVSDSLKVTMNKLLTV